MYVVSAPKPAYQPKYEYLMYQISLAAAYENHGQIDGEQSAHSLGSRIRTGYSSGKKRSSSPEHKVKVRMKWEDYLQIYNYVHKNDVSQRGADSLLAMLRDMHERHQVTIPLPLNYKTIVRCLEQKSGIIQGRIG